MNIILDLTIFLTLNNIHNGIARTSYEIAKYLLYNREKYNCKFVCFSAANSSFNFLSLREVENIFRRLNYTRVINIESKISPPKSQNYPPTPHRYLKIKYIINQNLSHILKIFKKFIALLPKKTSTYPQTVINTTEQMLFFQRGNVYINTNPAWNSSHCKLVDYLKQTKKIKVVGVLYDLIPINHPSIFDDSTPQYAKYFIDTSRLFDKIAAISEFSRHEFAEYVKKNNISVKPQIKTIYLGDKIRPQFDKTRDIKMQTTPYVLIVCTIEARKNHLALLKAWLEAEKKGIYMPNLICVGSPGWKVEGTYNLYNSSTYLKEKITFLSGIDDGALDKLYRNCLFTVFPSFVEGWGLGVAESLSYGKACIISTAPALNEAARGLMPRLDPDDHMAWMNEISSLTHDQDKRLKLEEKIKNEFKERKWETFAKEFIAFAINT